MLIGGIFDWGEIGKNDTFSKIFQIDLILPFFKFNFLKIDENINEILKNDISIDNKEIFPLNNLSKFISRDLHYYEKQYDKIHNKIKYISKQLINDQCCWYIVPEMMIGIPKYNHKDCTAYVIEKLRTNGFIIRYTHPNLLFSSIND